MKVIKKLGYRQEFNISKVKIALQKASKEADIKFTASNWKELKPRIESRLEPIMKDKEEIYFWEIDEAVIDSLLRSRFNELTKKYIQTRSEVIKDTLNDMGLSPHAMFIMKERYLRKGDDGKPIETTKELMCRVASAIATAEPNGLREKYTTEFSRILLNRDFLPNSPCLVAAGTKHKGTLAACFAYSIEDSLDDILSVVHKTARTFQLGGGVGVSIAKLRERGSKIHTTNGHSSGSVEFLNLFDVMCTTIKTGGFRRGALMCLTEYNHPDVEWFIHCKKDVNKLNNMNISVLVDDDFFKALERNEEILLKSPKTKEIVDKIPANLLLEHIANNIWLTGEPGLLFFNEMNRTNPTPHLGEIRLTNPCLTKDTWVFCSDGPRQISDLIDMGTKFRTKLMIDGGLYNSNGFHPTDTKDVFKIITDRGYELKATNNHLISTYTLFDRYHKETEWKRVDELREGDLIALSNNRRTREFWNGPGKYWQGYLLGQIVSDGYIEKDRERANIKLWETDIGFEGVKKYIDSIYHLLNTRSDFKGFRKYMETYNLGCKDLYKMLTNYGISHTKDLTPTLEKTSSEFYKGFICGMFDGDGTVTHNKEKGSSVRLAQNNLERLKVIQRMLARFGIISTIYKNRHHAGMYPMPDGRGELKEYYRQAMHELVISKDNIGFYEGYIGFKNNSKKQKLRNIILGYVREPYEEKFVATIKSIEHLGIEEVYDTTIEKKESFDANGIIVHNCSESNLLNDEACVLGSINLVNHMTEDRKDMDWDKLAITSRLATRFLDDMLDISPYPTEEVEKMIKSTRKIGVGIMGFADVLIHMGIRYSSKDAIKWAGKIMSFINDVCDQESISLGEEKGLYKEYRKGYRKRRNAITTVLAPTGTLSLIAGVSPGVEPNFYKEYSRIVDNKVINVTHPLKDREEFESCTEILPEQHLAILAEFQKHTENSVSKTINVPETTTVEDIKKIILKAHKLKVKGITILRHNSNREPLIKCEDCKI